MKVGDWSATAAFVLALRKGSAKLFVSVTQSANPEHARRWRPSKAACECSEIVPPRKRKRALNVDRP